MACCRWRAEPEVAVLHQEVGAVLLGRDRVVVDRLQDSQAGDLDLVSTGRALVLLDSPGQLQGRLLAGLVPGLPGLGRNRRLRDDGLGEAAPVADVRNWSLPLDLLLWSQPLRRTSSPDVVVEDRRCARFPSGQLLDVTGEDAVQPSQLGVAEQVPPRVRQRPGNVRQVDVASADRRHVAEGAQGLQVPLDRRPARSAGGRSLGILRARPVAGTSRPAPRRSPRGGPRRSRGAARRGRRSPGPSGHPGSRSSGGRRDGASGCGCGSRDDSHFKF